MKAKAKPATKFFKKIRHETFSFIGLAVSSFVLITNTAANYIIPAHQVYITSEGVRMEATTISTVYWIFTIIFIALVLLFLYVFLSPDNEWKKLKEWANKL